MKINYFFSKLKLLQLLIVLIGLVSNSSYAQYEKLLNKDVAERKVEIEKFSQKLVSVISDKTFFLELKKLKDFARKNNDVSLELEADFIEITRMIFLNTKSTKFKPETILKRCDVLYSKATENNLQDLKLRLLFRKGNYYWYHLGNYELGFEMYFVLDKELDKVQPDEFPEKTYYLNIIGEAFFFFKDYDQAIEYFKKGLSIPENNSNSATLNSIKNNIGLCYQQLNKLDSSEYFFKKVIASKPYKNHKLWEYIAKGNLAYVYFLKNQHEKAIPLLEESLKREEQFKQNGNAFNTSVLLADVYLKKGRIRESKVYLDKAEKLIGILDSKEDRLNKLQNFYPVACKWHQLFGNKDLAIKYLDSAIVAKDIHDKKFSALKLLRAQQKNDLQESRLATLKLQNEEQKKTSQRNIIFLALVSLIVVFSGIYFFQKKRHRREKQIQDLKLTISDQELKTATQQLEEFTHNLIEKNKMIELLQKKTDALLDNEIIEEIKKTTILTAEDWQKFQTLFEKVHTGFLYRLRSKYKELTASEIRYITLTKLNFTQKEKADILGISLNSVHVTSSRLSRKLHLSDTNTLENLLNEL